jgi:ribosomal protein L16 Arg81 hydroxylase
LSDAPRGSTALDTSSPPAAGGAWNLAGLIAPVTVPEFRESYWERDYLFIARGNPSFYEGIFSLADVDRCLASARLDSRDRLTLVAPPDRGQKPTRHRVAEVPMERLYTAFGSGETIRLDGVQESWPPLATLVAALELELNCSLNVNFYLTPADSQGFAVHFDTHDTFILQVGGAKEWSIYEPDVMLPVEMPVFLKSLREPAGSSLDESSVRLLRQARLETGDLLYVPRGFPHKAVASGAPSLHLTVGIHPTYWLDFLKLALERACVDEPALRRSLAPGALAEPALRDGLRETFEALLRTACEKASFDQAFAVLVGQTAAARPFPPDGHFAQLAQAAELEIGHQVRRRAGLACTVERAGDGASVEFATSVVRGPLSVLPALEFIRDHPSFQVGELPGLSDNSRLVLVRRLIREGLLAQA